MNNNIIKNNLEALKSYYQELDNIASGIIVYDKEKALSFLEGEEDNNAINLDQFIFISNCILFKSEPQSTNLKEYFRQLMSDLIKEYSESEKVTYDEALDLFFNTIIDGDFDESQEDIKFCTTFNYSIRLVKLLECIETNNPILYQFDNFAKEIIMGFSMLNYTYEPALFQNTIIKRDRIDFLNNISDEKLQIAYMNYWRKCDNFSEELMSTISSLEPDRSFVCNTYVLIAHLIYTILEKNNWFLLDKEEIDKIVFLYNKIGYKGTDIKTIWKQTPLFYDYYYKIYEAAIELESCSKENIDGDSDAFYRSCDYIMEYIIDGKSIDSIAEHTNCESVDCGKDYSSEKADVDEWFGEIDEFFDDYMKIKQLAERLSEEGYIDKSSVGTFILRVSGYQTNNKTYDIRWRGEDRDLYFLHKLLLGRFEGFTSYKNGSIDWKYGKLKDYFKGPDFIDCHLKCNRCSKEMKSILEDIFGLTISFTSNKGNISIRKPEESKE